MGFKLEIVIRIRFWRYSLFSDSLRQIFLYWGSTWWEPIINNECISISLMFTVRNLILLKKKSISNFAKTYYDHIQTRKKIYDYLSRWLKNWQSDRTKTEKWLYPELRQSFVKLSDTSIFDQRVTLFSGILNSYTCFPKPS